MLCLRIAFLVDSYDRNHGCGSGRELNLGENSRTETGMENQCKYLKLELKMKSRAKIGIATQQVWCAIGRFLVVGSVLIVRSSVRGSFWKCQLNSIGRSFLVPSMVPVETYHRIGGRCVDGTSNELCIRFILRRWSEDKRILLRNRSELHKLFILRTDQRFKFRWIVGAISERTQKWTPEISSSEFDRVQVKLLDFKWS